LPEENFNIWVNFLNHDGVKYHMVYSRDSGGNREYYPRTSLSSRDATGKDFNKMLEYIKRVNGGRSISGRPIYVSHIDGDISALIHEKKHRFTQKFIANMVKAYRKKFIYANISVGYYDNVSKRKIANPGFPREKITVNKSLVA
tara:strand:+ start:377 stop:808 length:432 start_codon:yes stop_codon:yes gene_type:complete